MTAYRYEYTPIPVPPNASQGIQNAFNSLNEQLNFIAQALAKIQGLNGLTPEFVNNVDFGGYQLQNVAAGMEGTDGIQKDQIFTLDALGSTFFASLGLAVSITSDTVTYSLGKLDIVAHSTSAVLTLSDMRKIHIFSSVSDLTCTLPSVGIGDLGEWVISVKGSTGELEIIAADADTILNSTAGGSIVCCNNLYSMQRFGLRLLTETQWHSGPECFGIWGTR